ncbi:aminopeptidase [Kocuria dechangensis]|uniref:Aminopeptidase n=1 Tax=Kocuria dechangensis TaxID=1176249 RepID=A0A917GRZ1_9MICC|nr:M28 family peptidase [Kocuria dechangensis]GGG55692.1 aminopeptidase [Kocuria dechangensis]
MSQHQHHRQQRHHHQRRLTAVAALAGALTLTVPSAVAAPVTSPAAGPAPAAADAAAITEAVSAERVMSHLEVFQGIATANQGNRASGTPGYRASADYVVGRLRAAGYAPRVQKFTFPYFQEAAPTKVVVPGPEGAPRTLTPAEALIMEYSGSGSVTAPVQAVDTTGSREPSTSGCEAEDFAGFTAGSVALLQRGTCPFAQKVDNAEAAGASAVLIFNSGTEGNEGVVNGSLVTPEATTLPVVGLSYAAGTALLAGGTVTVTTQVISENRETYNVIAETASGDAGNTVVVGAHLDSVLEGPGINDNGSGSAGILTIAEAMAGTTTANKVRFTWWGAEESGLLGSKHYVADLKTTSPAALEDVALYLNFDMIGSPNYGRFVYDGDHSAFAPVKVPATPATPTTPGTPETTVTAPAGSGAIEAAFHQYFGSVGLASGETQFSGRSDYGPFIAEGIPAGGLFTGAEGRKTVEQAALFGGRAGIPYDLCYHQACDDISNVNSQGLDEMADAAAAVVVRFATSTHDVNGKGEPAAPQDPGATGQPGGQDQGQGLDHHAGDQPQG